MRNPKLNNTLDKSPTAEGSSKAEKKHQLIRNIHNNISYKDNDDPSYQVNLRLKTEDNPRPSAYSNSLTRQTNSIIQLELDPIQEEEPHEALRQSYNLTAQERI